jgi:DNA-binding response OmpR family regulator
MFVNILLAEDDVRLGKLLVHMLEKEYHQVNWVKNGEDAYDWALTNQYDVLILDWMMPKLDGIQVTQLLRQHGSKIPILMLTAKDAVEDRIEGLDTGADDYLVKPFAFEELFARIRALGRRREMLLEKNTITVGDLSLDTATHTVIRQGRKIDLTRREYQLLELLMRHRGQVLTRELLIDRIWGMDQDVTGNSLDALVRLLRRKIDKKGQKTYIKTVRGVGFMIGDSHV